MTSIGWTAVAGEAFGAHVYTFRAQETQGAGILQTPELLARLYCHYLVSVLPNEALPDLTEELTDFSSQYLISPTDKKSAVMNPTRVKAKVGSTIPRPEIELDRE